MGFLPAVANAMSSTAVRRPATRSPVSPPPAPFDERATAPVISARTIGFHYGKHHAGNLGKLVTGTAMANQSLEEIILATAGESDKAAVLYFEVMAGRRGESSNPERLKCLGLRDWSSCRRQKTVA